MDKTVITEDFLYYIWKYKLFTQNNLRTTDGNLVEILSVGEHNKDAGPDFFNAKIKINNTLWAGNVEVHINSSDWLKHRHDTDKSYHNIILHVVYEADIKIKRNKDEILPTIELTNIIYKNIYKKYSKLITNKSWIPCQDDIKEIEQIIINKWLERLLIERLENKSENIYQLLKLNNNNWEESFYQHFARNFGLKINTAPFELLAKALPLKYLAKHKNNLFQIESLLFGQAGLLDKNFSDDYPKRLKKEYEHLKKKFNLKPLKGHLWKFLRLRPSNFPTIRIAQFAHLIYKSSHLFSKIIETNNLSDLKKLFTISTSDYWETHYNFDKPTSRHKKNLGRMCFQNIIVNTVIPFLFVYGKIKGMQQIIDRAVSFLEKIPGEKNSIITKWKTLGVPDKTASQTQALIQLKNNYCNQKKCLNCAIGNQILTKGLHSDDRVQTPNEIF